MPGTQVPLSLMGSVHTIEFHDIALFQDRLPLHSLVSLYRLGAFVAHSLKEVWHITKYRTEMEGMCHEFFSNTHLLRMSKL